MGFEVFNDDDEDNDVPNELVSKKKFQEKFENIDYSSKTFVKNLGETFLISLAYIVLSIIYFAWTFINKRRNPENISEKGKKRYT